MDVFHQEGEEEETSGDVKCKVIDEQLMWLRETLSLAEQEPNIEHIFVQKDIHQYYCWSRIRLRCFQEFQVNANYKVEQIHHFGKHYQNMTLIYILLVKLMI